MSSHSDEQQHEREGGVDLRQATTLTFTPQDIAAGITNGEFEPFFQPKLEIATGQVLGAEALARWRHPRLGVLAPEHFISTVEDSGCVGLLVRCILTKAVETCRALQANGHNGNVCVNVSLKSLGDPALADQIMGIVCAHHLDPSFIVLEITHTDIGGDIEAALNNLARLRGQGFGIAIDDAGTDAHEQLARIPVTELKIDQARVAHGERAAKGVLESSLHRARHLNIQAVAQRVETRENWDLLCELRCDVAQGYYVARPMPASDYMQWMEDWQAA